MVSCFECMKKLPYECTCNVPEETKIKRFFELVVREFKLCLAVFNGYIPKVKFGEYELTPTTIKIKGASIEITYDIPPERSREMDFNDETPIILFDDEGKPLYRRNFKFFGAKILRGCGITITWQIGATDVEAKYEVIKRFT